MKNVRLWMIGIVFALSAFIAWNYLQTQMVTVPGPMTTEFPPIEENRPPATSGFLFLASLEDPDGSAYYLAQFDGSGLWRLVDNPEGFSLAASLENNLISPEIAFIGRTEKDEVAVTMRKTLSGVITNEFTIAKEDWGTANGGVPTFVKESDDGSMLFFQNVGEDERVIGAWSVDTKSGAVLRYDYLDKFSVSDLSFNSSTKQIVGVWYTPAGKDEDPTGPSAVHVIDAVTGVGSEIQASATDVYRHPSFSPDGAHYIVQTQNENKVRLFDTKTNALVDQVSGAFTGWHDDVLMLSGPGMSYSIYNTTTKQTRVVGDFQKMVTDWREKTGRSNDSLELGIEYLGAVDITDQMIAE